MIAQTKLYFSIIALLFYFNVARSQGNVWAFTENLKNASGKYDIQSPEKAIGVIVYKQLYKPDSLHLDSTRIDTMALTYGNHFSDYRANGKRELDSNASLILNRMSQLDLKSETTEKFPFINYSIPKDRFLTDGEHVYEYKMVLDKHYLLQYVNQKINWTIQDSTQIIDGYTCQKAESDVLGRHYTAWFTTDLVGSFGPRTLVGLPGIILYAYDKTYEIQYKAIHIFQKNQQDAFVGLPKMGIKTTKKEFDAMIAALENNASAAGRNVVQGRSSANGQGRYTQDNKRKNKPNNSIELLMEN